MKERQNSFRKIVLNIPHSSINGIFDKEIGGWPCGPHVINNCILPLTDWFTDTIFTCDRPDVVPVVFQYSSFVCDTERLENDPMEEIGQGIVYTRYGEMNRNALSAESMEKIRQLRKKHLNALSDNLSPCGLLIDCHSFTAKDESEPDVCIGFNDDWSYNKSVVELIHREFRCDGYSTGINIPFSNSITPETGFKYSSVMIELNKRTYLDGSTLMCIPDKLMRLKECINRIYGLLLSSV